MLGKIRVDLARPPAQRWSEIAQYTAEAAAMADQYVEDLGDIGALLPMLEMYSQAFVSPEHRAEVESLAKMIGRPKEHLLIANLYYDAMHVLIGCTAFAVDTPSGPLHARNLDWWTANNALADNTMVAECSGGTCPGPYEVVSWPGAIGVYSAVAKGRFAITLNAVISDELSQLGESTTLFLRRVFDTAADYESALDMLKHTPIASDCLLLITGTQSGQMAVVERTSSRHAVRAPVVFGQGQSAVFVTNEYRALAAGESSKTTELQKTACSRFDRALHLVSQAWPDSVERCFAILTDDKVRMGITVQHMVMQASTGCLEVQTP